MWFKTALTYFLIILDVMIFPFACSNNQRRNEYIFTIHIHDEEHEYHYDHTFVTRKIPKDEMISLPENLTLENEDYEIVGWYIYHYQDLEEDFVLEQIDFPYQIQEEDYESYYKGHRNCVVIMAIWEYTGNDNA